MSAHAQPNPFLSQCPVYMDLSTGIWCPGLMDWLLVWFMATEQNPSVLHLTKSNYRPGQVTERSTDPVRQRILILILVHMDTNNAEMSSCQERQSQLRLVIGHTSPHWHINWDTSVQQPSFYITGSDSSQGTSAPCPGAPGRCSSWAPHGTCWRV